MPRVRALSIQQPFVEQILRGTKTKEYRSRATRIRERVFLYASMKPGAPDRWKGTGWRPGDLPAGMVVGSVEIVGCEWDEARGVYAYTLARPRRLNPPVVPENRGIAGPGFWRAELPDSVVDAV